MSTPVIRFGDKHLYLLSYLAGLPPYFGLIFVELEACLASKTLGSACSCPPTAKVTDVSCTPGFYLGAVDLDLGPRGDMVGSLPTEPSPQTWMRRHRLGKKTAM